MATSVRTSVLFLAGSLLLLLTGARWNIAILAWVSPVPFLLVARRLSGARAWAWFGLALSVVFTLQVLKIVTNPVPPPMALMFSLPSAAGFLVVIACSEWIRRRAGEHLGVVAFASLSALRDLASYAVSEMGAWTTASTTQVSSVLVMQLAALFGLWGIGLVMAWIAGVVAALAAAPPSRSLTVHSLVAFGVVMVLLGWATLRLERAQSGALLVAAITTDVGMGRDGLPTPEMLAANVDGLFARSQEAASRGARLIAWPEGATFVKPEQEAALVARAIAFATARQVDLALAYAVVVSETPLRLDNKVSLVTSEGTIAQTYRKHHPVPGEPSIKGTEPISVVQRPYAKIGFAICYDYDFPALAREHARHGAQVVVVPSSDWRGIDPVHTEMARARAIEGGFSVLRPVRWASSAAFDAFGRTRGWLPGRESGQVLVAEVPTERLTTLYALTGDVPAVVLILFLGIAIAKRD